MDKELFKSKTEHLLKYNKIKDSYRVADQFRSCTHCGTEVKNQRIECAAYRLGSHSQHFKHVCRPCNFILFDGSLQREPHKKPGKPMAVSDHTLRKGRGRSKRVITPDGEFDSLIAMAAHYKRSPSTMLYWLQKRPELYRYL